MAISRRSIYDEALVWDNHACLPMSQRKARRYLPELERYRRAGVAVVSINVGYGEMSFDEHVAFARFLRATVAALGDGYALIDSVADIEAARARGALAVCFDVEGAAPIDPELTRVAVLHALGVRWMLIAYNRNNPFGGGCHDDDAGLTSLGRKLITEMNRVGIVVCASHTGYRTARDAIDASAQPIIFSHSNPRALHDHPRNIPDELIRACAARGGVVGINGVGLFLGDNDTSAERMARHVDYAVQLVGADHVGIGTDYVFALAELEAELAASNGSFPAGWGYEGPIDFAPPERLRELAENLSRRGYGDADLAAILGGNFMRIARRVWK